MERSYAIDGFNRITHVRGIPVAYDTRGNLTSGGVNSYTHTVEKLLKTGPGAVSGMIRSAG